MKNLRVFLFCDMQKTSLEELYQNYILGNQTVCTDTRKLVKGSMFFALKGEKFDANTFADNALAQGCRFAVVDDKKYANKPNIILVENTLSALQQLANYHRRKFSIPFLGITGSNGKTTNKELINAVLSKKWNVLATTGNLNNHIGVPLTLLELRVEHEFAIIEMGANHQGEINSLCQIAEPDFGLITNIGKAHLEGFGGIEGVKKGKSELYRYLKQKGAKTFINGDDETLLQLACENDKITYGCNKLYDLIGKDISNSDTVSFKYTTRYGNKDWSTVRPINTKIIGGYNFINCLAAVCVGNYFKVEPELIQVAIEDYLPNMNRSQLVKTKKNTLILDAYNANPNSMKVAIENFAKFKSESKLVLLGDMFELGVYSSEEHQKLLDLLWENNLKNAILVGSEFYKLKDSHYLKFKTTLECKEYLKNNVVAGTTVLIKGSRGMKMEILQEAL